MPNKGLIEEKQRKKSFHTHTSQLSLHLLCQFFLSVKFHSYSSYTIISFVPPILTVFQCILLPPGPPLPLFDKDPEGGLVQLAHMSVRYSSQHIKKKKNIPHPITLSPLLVLAKGGFRVCVSDVYVCTCVFSP